MNPTNSPAIQPILDAEVEIFRHIYEGAQTLLLCTSILG